MALIKIEVGTAMTIMPPFLHSDITNDMNRIHYEIENVCPQFPNRTISDAYVEVFKCRISDAKLRIDNVIQIIPYDLCVSVLCKWSSTLIQLNQKIDMSYTLIQYLRFINHVKVEICALKAMYLPFSHGEYVAEQALQYFTALAVRIYAASS